MAKPEIVWAFLPDGIKDGKLKFSAAVSIRLPEESGKKDHLGSFPEILDWAGTVKGMTFAVQMDKSTTLEATRTSPDPDPELWKAIFQEDAPVLPYRFTDMSRRPLLAFPVKHVHAFVAQQYINVAAESPEEPPEMERVFRNEALAQVRLKPVTSPRFADGVQPQTSAQAMEQSVRTAINNQKIKAMPVSDKPSPAQDFYLLRLYHQPRNKAMVDPKTRKPVVPRVPIAPPELDFHQAMASLTNYPALMRLLGLAIDFEVALPGGRRPNLFSARIVPHGRTGDKAPWTRCRLQADKGIFEAASRSSRPEVVDGFLDLSDGEKFDLIQIDVDGAALKTAEMADKAEAQASGDLPALRSSGFSVVRTGNAVVLADALRKSAEHHQALSRGQEATFYAEDLIQGYRVDIWDEASKRWHSLCKRIGTYNFLRSQRMETLEDEGFVTDAVTESTDGSSEDLFTHEAIFGWEGWSLVAPRPGRTIDKDDQAAAIQSKAATAFRLETQFRPVPGSLPRLRFGGRYRVRARAVDLAGNSIGCESPDASKAIPPPPKEPEAYRRFDPVAPPVVVLRTEPGRGETVDEVVLRSFNDSPAKDTVATEAAVERHIVPPKTSELGAEVHGMLDAPKGGLRKDLYGLIARKDPGKLREVEPDGAVELPYFPDPWAHGVVVRGLPGAPADRPMRIEFKGEWPDRKSFRLRVAEGDGPASWDDAARILTVRLKKAETVTLRMSCWFPELHLPHLGLYRWLEKPELAVPPKILQAPQATVPLLVVPPGVRMQAPASAPPASSAGADTDARTAGKIRPQAAKASKMQVPPAKLQAARDLKPVFQLPRIDLPRIKLLALNASHWMLTPSRKIVLTHAVQQPLGRPAHKGFMVLRDLGDTHAVLDAELTVHGASSQKIDLDAAWREPIDNVAEAEWRTLDGAAHVLEQTLERAATSLRMKDPVRYRHEFGDTRYRRVTYRLTETTRFREQMPEAIASNPEQMVRRSDPIVVDVPNAAPPAMPGVLYVVPTFGWERQQEPEKYTSLRKGGGLRVYLERPWFASGDGELLAVVLTAIPGVPTQRTTDAIPAPARPLQGGSRIQADRPLLPAQLKSLNLPKVPEALRPYVTLWGLDPLWRAGLIPKSEYPGPADFPQAEEILGGLTLPELPEPLQDSDSPLAPTFTAVGHKVAYDAERALWYCDIEIEPHEAYFPFVRLALARFQPVSVPGAHLSKVVTADFIQLAPDRTVSLSFKKRKPSEMHIAVSGASYVKGAAENGPGTVEVALEAHNAALPEELGWAEVPGTAVQLKSERKSVVGHYLWTGKLKIPKNTRFETHRVIVREYETFYADDTEGASGKLMVIKPQDSKVKKVRRLVFAETFPLYAIESD